jgi:hypothetical protein
VKWITAARRVALHVGCMTFHTFEQAVIQLASRGTRLTVANVVAHLSIEPSQAEDWMDEMARQSRLDVELDEDVGLIYYRVRGLTPAPAYLAPAGYGRYAPPAATTPLGSSSRASSAPMKRQKSTKAAAVFGLLLPGAGLFYAAPFSAAVVAGLLTLVAVKMAAVIPLIGPLMSSVALGVCALVSALFGVLYARRYNQHGRRTHLAEGTPRRIYSAASDQAAQLAQ